MNSKIWNPDVPPEAVIRQLTKENNELRQQVGELTQKLSIKENAIKAFKEWQAKICSYKYHYWLNEGLRMADEIPNEQELNALRTFLGQLKGFKTFLCKLNTLVVQVEKSGSRLKKIMEWKEN